MFVELLSLLLLVSPLSRLFLLRNCAVPRLLLLLLPQLSFLRGNPAAPNSFFPAKATPNYSSKSLNHTCVSLIEPTVRPAMSESAHPLGTPPATATPTSTAADEQPALSAKLNNSVVNAVNDATRDTKFGPGAGQAFFSTGLGACAPRSPGNIRRPVIARSVQDPAVVVQAATYWQVKYKSQ